MGGSSKAAVVKAVAGNGVVTIVKGIAWIFSGSGAMLSETIHSFVDTLNQGLLLIGNTRSLMAPTDRYPYGFGVEANFWGLLAAIGILVFGGGLSFAHGLEALSHPEVPTQLPMVLSILAVAFAIEAYILYAVMKDLSKTRGDKPWIKHISEQPPGITTVLLEDAAACGGILIAAVCIALCVITGNGIWDAIGQLVIGGMLGIVGLVLIWRSRGMLIGLAAPPEKIRELRAFLEDLDGVARVTDLKTRQLGHGMFRLKAEVVFSGGHIARTCLPEFAEQLAAATEEDDVKRILGPFSERLMEEQARLVDELEDEIVDRFPGAVNIDLEPHLRDF